MDTVAVDTGAFWQRGPGESCWQGGEEEADDELHQGIRAYEGGSRSFQDSAQLGSAEFGPGLAGYGYSGLYDYGPADADPDIAPLRRGEKRRSESLPAEGFDTPQTPNSPLVQSSSSKARNSGTGSLFFKTKLCIKFKAGTCPYNSSCNFAHGMDELRKPPPGWEDMVGNQDIGTPSGGSSAVPSSADLLRFRRARRCKKYFSDEGCPYGERCNFLHDDEAKARESNAISLGPTSGSVAGGSGSGSGSGNGNGNGNGSSGAERPSNWKTRMCNKWETTGYCPFGQKCNFAHGFAELQMYAGAVTDGDAKQTAASGMSLDSKQAPIPRIVSKTLVDGGSTAFIVEGQHASSLARYRTIHPSLSKSQKQMKVITNWKGPADEISTIYGDWIEEDE